MKPRIRRGYTCQAAVAVTSAARWKNETREWNPDHLRRRPWRSWKTRGLAAMTVQGEYCSSRLVLVTSVICSTDKRCFPSCWWLHVTAGSENPLTSRRAAWDAAAGPEIHKSSVQRLCKSARSTWNDARKDLELTHLKTLGGFETIIKDKSNKVGWTTIVTMM